MGFSSAFNAIANDPFGEPARIRAYLRADTGAGADQLITLSGLEQVLDVSEVSRYREREWGIAQGQQWEVRLANVYDTFNRDGDGWPTTETSILLKWCALEIGFPEADEWEVVAQGRIHRTRSSTDGTTTLQIGDPIMDLLRYLWPRDAVFDDRDAWVSPVRTVRKAAASSDFLHTTGPTVIAAIPASDVADETFQLVFASGTTYDVVYEDGTTQAGGPFSIVTATVDMVSNVTSQAVVRIYTADWDATGGAYSAGDTFELYTSQQYASATLQPVELIQELISQAGLDTGYDVLSGASQSLYYDASHWSDVATAFSATTVRGYWPRGSDLMTMIQDILKAMNATIYPTTTGQVAIWHLSPEGLGDTVATINGDPDEGAVSISSADRTSDHEDLVNLTTWSYGNLNFLSGDDGNVPDVQTLTVAKDDLDATTFVDPVTGNPVVRQKDVEIRWAVDSVTIDAASNRYLNRFKTDVPVYRVSGGLAHILSNEITDAVSITEPFLAESLRKIQVASIGCRPMENTAELIGWLDPVLAENYILIGTSVIDGTDVVF